MDADKLVRRTSYTAVFAVASVAGLLSYWHAVTVVGKHGQPGVYGHLYPATIDGLLIAASMVLLDAARNHEKPHWLAWLLAAGGTFMTLGANVLDGIEYGFLGSVIAAWPALALVGAYEMIMILIRNAARRASEKADIALPSEGMRLTPREVEQIERALDAEPKPAFAPAVPQGWQEPEDREMPKLQALLAEKPPWENAPEVTDPTPTGRMARLDAKTQSDEKVAIRQTGTFGAVNY